MNESRQSVATACQRHGKDLTLPGPGAGDLFTRDGANILWAFAGAESTFGDDTAPRHEAAYCRGGKYFDAGLTNKWGCLAHCSYGPWQVMFANYPPGFDPPMILAGALAVELNIAQAVKRLNLALRQGANTLADLADAYNSGNFRDAIVPVAYIADVENKYHIAMPTSMVEASAT